MIPMLRDLTRLHDIFLYLTLLLAFAATAVGGGIGVWLILFFPISLLGAHLFYRAGMATPAHTRWWNALILMVAAASVIEYLVSTRIEPMNIGVRFVLILILIKLFSRQGPRDEMQLHALAFLTLAAASTFNEELSYGVLFALYVLTGTFGLALLHLKTEADRHPQLNAPRRTPFDRLYASILALLSVAIFVGSLVVFFAFPRVGLGLFMEQSRQSLSVAGFADSVSVGDHGAIRDNPAVVMRVDFDERPADAHTFLWRTMTFDRYEGGQWSRSQQGTEVPGPYSRRRSYSLDPLYTDALQPLLGVDPTTGAETEPLRMRIYLEPLGTNILPSLWPAAQIDLGRDDVSGLLRGNPPSLTIDRYGDLRLSRSSDLGLTYALYVYDKPPADFLRRPGATDLPRSELQRYLQLPELAPRVPALAAEITADAESNYEKAEAIGDYFFREFQYTLDLPQISGEPVEAFLFTTRTGHCEYFASAAVVLLRTQGVPARVVNGFLGGAWNELGDYLTVRQGDAHAWIEVYVPDLGWIPYDPTPPIASSFLELSGILPFFRDATDAMRQVWFKWVLEYDLQAQAQLLRRFSRAMTPTTDGEGRQESPEEEDEPAGFPLRELFLFGAWGGLLFLGVRRGQRWPRLITAPLIAHAVLLTSAGAFWVGLFHSASVVAFLAGGTTVALSIALPAALRWRNPTDQEFASLFFQRIELAATKTGQARRPDEGPGDFLSRLPEGAPFRRVYLSVRFGGATLSEGDRRAVQEAAHATLRALRAQSTRTPS